MNIQTVARDHKERPPWVITTTVMYEGGVLRPTRTLDLPEHGTFRAFILPALPKAGAETLGDILGIDLSDEAQLQALAESQHQAVMEIAGLGQSGLTDVSEHHDRYLYASR